MTLKRLRLNTRVADAMRKIRKLGSIPEQWHNTLLECEPTGKAMEPVAVYLHQEDEHHGFAVFIKQMGPAWIVEGTMVVLDADDETGYASTACAAEDYDAALEKVETMVNDAFPTMEGLRKQIVEKKRERAGASRDIEELNRMMKL